MSDVQKIEETPAVVPVTETPVEVPVTETPAVEAPKETEAIEETAAETTEAAAPAEEVKEEIKPATDGTLGYKAPGLVK